MLRPANGPADFRNKATKKSWASLIGTTHPQTSHTQTTQSHHKARFKYRSSFDMELERFYSQSAPVQQAVHDYLQSFPPNRRFLSDLLAVALSWALSLWTKNE